MKVFGHKLTIAHLALALVVLALPIVIQLCRLYAAKASYDHLLMVWKADRVLCEDVIAASKNLMRVERASALLKPERPRQAHVARMKALLRSAENKSRMGMFTSFEAMRREPNLIRAEIAAVGGTAP